MRARPQPTLPVVVVPQRARPSAVPVPAVDSSNPPADEVPIDECPEFVLLSEKLVDVAVPPETIVMNG